MTGAITARVIAVVEYYLVKHRPTAPLPTVKADSAFHADLACDPIDMVCICLAIEDQFEIQLPADEPEQCELVSDLVALVTRLVPTFEAA